MANLIIDKTIPQETRENIVARVQERIKQVQPDIAHREKIVKKRRDFFEGRHSLWTNVVGQTNKRKEGHINATFNYIGRFVGKLSWALTNEAPRLKIHPTDESNEIEVSRAQAVEDQIMNVIEKENKFFKSIFKKLGNAQIVDADTSFDCRVVEDNDTNERKIVINGNEDILKLGFLWDDASGSSFSGAVYVDNWSVDKIKNEFGIDVDPYDAYEDRPEKKGDHISDQYGLFADTEYSQPSVPENNTTIPKAKIVDYWGIEIIDGEKKVINLIFINDKLKQFVVTEYRKIPRWIVHSMVVAGKPLSKGFIDDLVDPQIEFNDRFGEEGDLIRVGAHMKFLAINMPDFDPKSIKPGSGQVIFLEGEGADFRPLQMTISPFPSRDYLDRVKETLFDLGIPKIGLAAGTAPYTGKVGAIQYQPIIDLVTDFRIQWELALTSLIDTIQEYFIDFFPELRQMMTESIWDEETKSYIDGDPIIREVSFDWGNILPLSRSDKVIDASTLYDRNAISHYTYLEQAGFRDPSAEIKKIKQEYKDQELVSSKARFSQLSRGVVKAELEARKAQMEQEEVNAERMGAMQESLSSVGGNESIPSPILNQSQNDGRRGILSATGTPTGQTATPEGAVKQVTQNLNAKAGV